MGYADQCAEVEETQRIRKEYPKLKKQVEIMKEALEFYADEENVYSMVDSRGFSEARQALEKIKELER